ncbi:spondin domain-containing protein [Haloarcula salinisoli]|uniref:Spondin domain-containing protein n=1 Tax=Haloarcula salinisoli TaxID=2487746 RepID=A0A8J7YLK6_9EURY|nr:spondin domain-containing protein [Halomicroarcula salinisoli]MBX0285095.1 spondin domain-containing protein [Halomicroarcula salinisoli]MBX0303428.1 spondin domain-containing protein [Halomicroarcula salinisoli]
MSDSSTRRKFIAATGSAAALALAGCSGDTGGSGTTTGTAENMTEAGTMDDQMTEDGMMEQRTVTVRIENVAPSDFYGADSHTGGGIWITPGAYAVHSGDNPIFTEGEAASIGLEALAEAGPPTGFEGEPGLVDELGGMNDGMGDDGDSMDDSESMDNGMSGTVAHSGAYTPENTVADPNDPMGEVPGAPPIAPGGAFEFDVQATPGQKLSFASMFVPSNDIFISPGAGGIPLWPEEGEPVDDDVTDSVYLWDAGTEPNGEPGQGPDQAPAQDSATQGGDEGGVVRRLNDVDDGYSYPDVSNVIRVTLTPHESMDGGGMNDGNEMGTETMGDDSMN